MVLTYVLDTAIGRGGRSGLNRSRLAEVYRDSPMYGIALPVDYGGPPPRYV